VGSVGGEETRMPHLRLDELLDELQTRIDAARGTRDRVSSLLEAVMSVGQELDLPQVLRRIVEAAVTLVNAEYGALGVVEGSRLSEFLTSGLTEEQIRAIGPYPSGHGILGELIRHPRPLRLTDISEHPASYGFPERHPPMHTFLGVPIRVRDEVFGNLYLTEKRGGGDFDGEDETVLRTLAVAAGVAIENARLYAAATDRQRWLEANGGIVRDLLSGATDTDVLEEIVRLSRDILGADLGVIAVPDTAGEDLHVVIASGVQAEAHRGLALPRGGSFMGEALEAGRPVTTPAIREDRLGRRGPPRWAGLGPVVAVPMATGARPRGVLLLARLEQAQPFGEVEIQPLSAFAGQAALAMELAERRRSAERMTVLEDRDRIARDLHDLAIQRLFATGMTLQSALRFVQDGQAAERVSRAVDELDETIKIIRSTIFGLRAHEEATGSQGLRSRVAAGVEEAGRALGYAPSLRMAGLIDTDVPPPVGEDALAVLAEALSNVARHAKAAHVDVCVEVDDGELTVTVTDDGVGLPAGGRHSGLRNLAERAERLGGRLDAAAGPDGGTRLEWRVPVRSRAPWPTPPGQEHASKG
jgi:signal transduction histidine kinase